MKHTLKVLLASAFLSPFVYASPDKPPVIQRPRPNIQFTANLPVLQKTTSVWLFENGAVLAIDPNTGIDFMPKDEIKAVRLFTGPISQYPARPELTKQLPGSFAFNPDRLAFLEVGGHPVVVTQEGKIVRLPFDVSALADSKAHLPFSLSKISQKDHTGQLVQYAIISIRYADPNDEEMAKIMKEREDVAGSLNYGETFIVRQDGEFVRLDYRAHDKGFNSEFAFSNDGLLTSKGSQFHRAFDISKFDIESKFVSRQVDPIMNPNGAAVDPALLVRTFAKSMSSTIVSDIKDRKLQYQGLTDDERDAFRRSLAKVEMNSMAVLGPAGSGKTELVKSFIAEVVQGKVSDIPRSTQFLSIEAGALGAGTKWVGSMEARIQALIAYSEMVPLVLVIDEIHSLTGQGSHSQNSNDIFEYLKPYMATGQIRIIGMSTKEEFERAFSSNRALYQRFNQLHMRIPSRDEVLAKFLGWTKKHNLPAPAPEVLQRAYDLSEEFNAIGAQPRKGILLLIEAYADLKINGRDSEAPTRQDLDVAARRVYNLDPLYFERGAIRSRLGNLAQALDSRIVGQKNAKEVLMKQATINLAGAQEPNRPRMSAMFVGPKGTGKTDLAFAYGAAMGLPVKRLQLSQFNPYDGPTALLREIKLALELNALTLFILDEADKCPKNVLDVLLPILDGGRFVLPAHVNNNKWIEAAEVSALNSQFIITANYATNFSTQMKSKAIGFMADHSGAKVDPTDEALRQTVVNEGFSEFILDRVNAIVHMDHLVKDDFRGVLKLHIAKILEEQTRRQGIVMTPEDNEAMLDSLTDEYYGPALSNRTALRLLNEELRLKIAEAILAGELKPNALDLKYNAETKSLEACESLLGGKKSS